MVTRRPICDGKLTLVGAVLRATQSVTRGRINVGRISLSSDVVVVKNTAPGAVFGSAGYRLYPTSLTANLVLATRRITPIAPSVFRDRVLDGRIGYPPLNR